MHHPFQHKSASILLHDIADSIEAHEQPHIELHHLASIAGRRTFSFIIIIFAVLNILPLAMVPGFAVITAIPILFVALQLLVARQYLWLPNFIAKRTLPVHGIVTALHKSLPLFRKLESLLKPRLQFLFSRVGLFFFGLILIFLSGALMLPIPFSNNILGFLLLLYALSLLEYDGIMLLVAVILTITYFTIIWNVMSYLWKVIFG